MRLLSVATFALLVAGSAAAFDSSFEDETLTGWEIRPEGAWSRTDEDARHGRYSLRFSGGGANAGKWCHAATDPTSVAPRDIIEVSASARAVEHLGHRACSIAVEGRQTAGWMLLEQRQFVQRTKHWHPILFPPVAVPEGVDAVRVVLRGHPGAPEGAAWLVDDVTLHKTVQLSNYVQENAGKERLKDILLLVPDTLRADSLSCYGSAATFTSAVDRLTREGRRYENATTACPWTKPSFASIFTSRYPSQHTVEDTHRALPGPLTTLAEALKERGYFTAGFVFSAQDGYLGALSGFAQGFDVYQHHTDEDELTAAVVKFLKDNANAISQMTGGGIFLFVHMFDPHAPFENHYPKQVINRGKFGTIELTSPEHFLPIMKGDLQLGRDYTEADVDYARRLYALGVDHMDEGIAQMLSVLEGAGALDGMNVVFTADHGESLGEKETVWGHGMGWEPITRVPLILRLPGLLEPGIDDETLVSTLDILPTLLAVAGCPPLPDMEGRNLLDREQVTAKPLYGISEDRRHGWLTIRDARYKLVAQNACGASTGSPYTLYQPESNVKWMLFDLAVDAGEIQDLKDVLPDEFQRLQDALRVHCDRTGIAAGGTESDLATEQEVSPETEEALRALGYVE